MDNSEHEQDSHRIVQNLPISAVEFRNRCEGESKRHALKEVGVSTRIEEEWVRVGVRGSGLVVPVANVLLSLTAAVENTIGEVEEVGGEGKGPSASNCCAMSARALGSNWKGASRSILGTGTPMPIVVLIFVEGSRFFA